jgi:hypothetical protein
MALMFVMVEASPGAFRLRLVTNDDLIRDLKAQGALEGFLADVDQLYFAVALKTPNLLGA